MPRNHRRYAALLGALALALAPLQAAPTPAHAARPTLVWSDEFAGPEGTAPDPQHWHHVLDGQGHGNHELEDYTADPANAALDGAGHLLITARAADPAAGLTCWYGPCTYTSARLDTDGLFSAAAPGRFEARIKLPCGTGLWPAFWALGTSTDRIGWPAGGEIDVMEQIGSEPGTVHSALHGPGGFQDVTAHALPAGQRFCEDYHVYGVERRFDRVLFSVDGVVHHTVLQSQAGWRWVFNAPFYLVLDLAVGGDWPGPPDAGTVFPAVMSVDWVRVWRN
ncbi:family 16 glycosylhydrolase [Kitasatospora sp. MMS16-BH015]|uniref:glycoside hydrolase family 16 protein n=1 Tax=Kitasatospora sp. MMS16-BH015 TaxID=2018025 RepID=UPI00131A5A92|nr:glycoside hydrolase family 16 protein [Kitasatospora sp. MMS16-BH015]